MNITGKILLVATIFLLICSSHIYSCDTLFCDEDFTQDMRSVSSLLGDCINYDAPFKDIKEIYLTMCPSCYNNPDCECKQYFRKDIKKMISLGCGGQSCSHIFGKNARVLISLICRQSECSYGCVRDNYQKFTRKLIYVISEKQSNIALPGEPKAPNRKKLQDTSNRLLRVLEESHPNRFSSLKIGLAVGQLQQAARRSGTNLLMLASAIGDLKVVEKLLSEGKKLNSRNKMGKTALIYAASEGHPNVVEALLKSGADPKLRDKDGNTASDLAKKAGHDAVEKILEEAVTAEE